MSVNEKDFRNAFKKMPKNRPKETPILVFTKTQWKIFRNIPCGLYWTDEQLDNAVNGFIGQQNGVNCYITPLL